MEFDRVKFTGLRVTRKLSQDELAARMDVSRTTLAKWEKGDAVPSLKHINDAAVALNVTPEELVTKTEKRPNENGAGCTID